MMNNGNTTMLVDIQIRLRRLYADVSRAKSPHECIVWKDFALGDFGSNRCRISQGVFGARGAGGPENVYKALRWTLSIGRNTESRISRGNWPFRNYDFEFYAFQ